MVDSDNDNNNGTQNEIPNDESQFTSSQFSSDDGGEPTSLISTDSFPKASRFGFMKERVGGFFRKLNPRARKEAELSSFDSGAEVSGTDLSSAFSPEPAHDESPLATHSRGGSALSSLRRIELLNVAEWFSKGLQTRGYAFYGKLFTVVVCSYFLADVLAIVGGHYIPEPPATRIERSFGGNHRFQSLNEYSAIFTRNLFNSKGIIPGEDNGGGPIDLGGAPVRTSLPFQLIGTMILQNPDMSIATIQDTSANMVYPVRIDEEIPQKAKILKIEPRKVIFVNLQSGRREFVELPDEPTNNAHLASSSYSSPSGPSIERTGRHQFSIDRSEVDKTLADFNKVLTEARAVPNFENGVAAGYKLFQIVPGSIYDKLGLHNGDVIAGVDGQPINDPAKAFALLGKLKEGASHMELQVKTPDGSMHTYIYDIR